LNDLDAQSDEALVARAGAGDRTAASALVLRHTDRIYAVSVRMLCDGAAAEDATQETFLRLWKHAAQWKPRGAKFETWLYRVAMNICLDRLRKTKREAPAEAAPEQVDTSPRADEMLIAEERSEIIAAALASLPDRQRQAIALCHHQELSNIEAAEIMEISIDAIESLLARARRGLRDRLVTYRSELMGVL